MLVMMMLAAAALLVLALVSGAVLGWANRAFHVEVDPRIEAIAGVLPGANCGGCGFIGCGDYAAAVVNQGAPVNKCTVGGASCAAAVARIMGVEAKESWPARPVVHCRATLEDRLLRAEYRGEQTCAAANVVSGVQGCTYGCLGLGDCARACSYGALRIVRGLAEVDYEKCVGCGACARACPRHILTMVPFKAERMVVIACSNRDFGKDVRNVCKVGCLGCKACEKAMGSLFKVVDNLPRIDYEAYSGDPDVAPALQKCPSKTIVRVGKPSPRDLEATRDQKVPGEIPPDPRSSVDRTSWRG